MIDQKSLAVLLVCGLFVCWASWHHSPSNVPVYTQVPAQACEPWMADCLQGIGPRRRVQVAAAIRLGEIDQLPQHVQERIFMLFCEIPQQHSSSESLEQRLDNVVHK